MGFGGGGSSSQPQPVAPAPTKSSAEVQEAARTERLKRTTVRATTRGRASQVLTGGQGDIEETPAKVSKLGQ